MGNLTHLPVADWLNAGWNIVGGALSLWATLNNDTDTMYIQSPASKSGAAVTFPVDTTNVPVGAVITSVTVSLRCATGTGSAPSGVSPSITVSVGAQDDTALFTTRTIYPTSTITTYDVATYKRDALGLAWDIERLNHLICRVFSYVAVFDLIRCYKFFCQVNYRVRPTITVNAPTGTVYTPSPIISWSYSQTDGDPQVAADYRLFTAAQVAQVSFNPDTAAPVFSATTTGDVSSVTLPTSINPDTYWVYVRSYSSFGAVSTWVGRQFTVNGPSPGTPGVADPTGTHAPGVGIIETVPDSESGSAALILRDTSNLLSSQAADAESLVDTPAFTNDGHCTLARSTAAAYPGETASWAITSNSTSTMTVYSDWVEIPGDTTPITGRCQFKAATAARNCAVLVQFFDPTFTLISTLTGTTVADATSTWTEAVVTGYTPAANTNPAYARLAVQVQNPGASSEVHYADHLGLMYGSSTPYSDGGQMSRNLLSSWYSTTEGTAGANESWTAGTATTTTTVATTGTGSSGSTCNKMTYVGLSPTLGLRAAGTVFTSPTSGTNYTLNKPAGVASGDLMLAFITTNESTTSVVAPAGWTVVDYVQREDGSTDTTLTVLKRTAGGSEPSTWTDGYVTVACTRRSAVVVAYSGAADASQQFIGETTASTANGTPTYLTTPTLNNTDPNAWRVSAFAVSDDATGGTLVANLQQPSTVPPIQFVGVGTAWGSTTSGAANFTINKPSGVVQGDLMVASMATVSTGTATAPSGWTIQWQGQTNSNGGPSLLAVMYKIAGASEPSSYTGSYSGGTSYGRTVVESIAYRNVNSSTPFIAGSGQSFQNPSSIYTPTLTNTDSSAWRISVFAGLTTNSTSLTSDETIFRTGHYQSSGGGTESNAIFDSNGPVSTGSYSQNGYSTGGLYAAQAFLGILKPLTAPPSGVANETTRATASVGSSNPWMTTIVADSAGAAATGIQSLTGIWTPGTGTDMNSMAGWFGIIKPATPVVAGYAIATMNTTVDVSSVSSAVPGLNQLTATVSFLGSTGGTPYLTVNFYRANQLLESLVAQGSSFGTTMWVKSSATFTVPAGTTRVQLGVSVSDRSVSDYVLFDRCSLAFGSDATYRPGTSQSTHPVWAVPHIQYADDDGTGYKPYADLPGSQALPPAYDELTGLANYTDHTVIPLTNRKYRAQTITYGLAGDQFVSGYGPDSSEFSFTAQNWWLKDIANPDSNIQLSVKWDSFTVGTTNTAVAFQPLGSDLPVVLTEGFKGQSFTVDLIPVVHDDWSALLAMLRSGRTLFLQTDIDHAWWCRPVGDVQSIVLPTDQRQSKPLREIKASFIEVESE